MQSHADIEPRDPITLPQLHLAAMRKHDRAAALRLRDGAQWRDTPDWRFERQVIRIGLFLRERGLSPGDRVAVVSPLRSELVVTEQAALALGAASVALDPGLTDAELAAAMAQIAPKAVFVEVAALLDRVGGQPRVVVCFDGPVAADRGSPWTEALDLGGTLDTPERAQSFRAQARDVRPEMPALGFFSHPGNGSAACEFLTHSQAMALVREARAGAQAAKGDAAYVAAGPALIPTRIALYALLGDGLTTVALGSPGHELEEIAELRPKRIVAPQSVLEAARRIAAPAAPREPVRRGWIERITRLLKRESGTIREA